MRQRLVTVKMAVCLRQPRAGPSGIGGGRKADYPRGGVSKVRELRAGGCPGLWCIIDGGCCFLRGISYGNPVARNVETVNGLALICCKLLIMNSARVAKWQTRQT